jgi:hypothetical protein
VNEARRAEWLEMSALDQRLRLELLSRDAPEFPAARAWLRELDVRYAARLEALLEAHGWLGFALLGWDGAQAAWLIAPHADANRAVQGWFLDSMTRAVFCDDADARQMAILTGRVCIGMGRPQVYGTQLRVVEAELEPFEIRDAEGVDASRSSVELEPLEVYIAGWRR